MSFSGSTLPRGKERGYIRFNNMKTIMWRLSSLQDAEAWPDAILMSNTTQEEWKLELERVLPQLKVTIRSGNSPWSDYLLGFVTAG